MMEEINEGSKVFCEGHDELARGGHGPLPLRGGWSYEKIMLFEVDPFVKTVFLKN